MPNTVPNQRIIAIHRERAASDFLGIKNDNCKLLRVTSAHTHSCSIYTLHPTPTASHWLYPPPPFVRLLVCRPLLIVTSL